MFTFTSILFRDCNSGMLYAKNNSKQIANHQTNSEIPDTNLLLFNNNIYVFSPESAKEILPEYLQGGALRKITPPPWKSDIFLFAFLMVFTFIAYLKFIKPQFLNELFLLIEKSDHVLTELYPQKRMSFYRNILLDLSFIIVVTSFFTYQTYLLIDFDYETIFIATAVVFLAQFLIISVAYRIFFGRNPFNIHLINFLTFNRFLGVILAPLIFIMLFIQAKYSVYIAGIITVTTVIVFIFRALRIFSQLKKAYPYNYLYILLYICVLEISPFIILIKEFFKLTL